MLGQNPTVYFDKTRCQNFSKTKNLDSLPYPFSLVKHLQQLQPTRTFTKDLQFSIWKKEVNTFRELATGKVGITILLQEPGNYFLQVHDQINPIIIELELNDQQCQFYSYLHCAIHE